MRLWVIGAFTILYYDGEGWQTIMTEKMPLFSTKFTNPRAIFVPDAKSVLVSCFGSGAVSMLYLFDQQNYFNYLPLIGSEYFAFGIDGISFNDFVIGGGYVGIEHFNGAAIINYPNLLGPGDILGLDYESGHVFMVGLSGPSDYRGLFIHGIQQ